MVKEKTADEDLVYVLVDGNNFWHHFWNLFMVLVAAWFIWNIFFIDTTTAEVIDYQSYDNDRDFIISLKDDFADSNEPHWTHMPLTYEIDNTCGERLQNLMILGMDKINNETSEYVTFEKAIDNPDIYFYCRDFIYDPDVNQVLADTLITYDTENDDIITHIDVNMYGQGQICATGYPALEVHELLHGLGFDHNVFLESIMSAYAEDVSRKCKITKIDKPYTDCLMYIYSNGEVGDCSESKINVYTEDIEYIEEYECEDGWYYSLNKEEYCCPEPDMEIDWEGYCV